MPQFLQRHAVYEGVELVQIFGKDPLVCVELLIFVNLCCVLNVVVVQPIFILVLLQIHELRPPQIHRNLHQLLYFTLVFQLCL